MYTKFRTCFLFATYFLLASATNAQDFFATQRKAWLQKAEESKPVLTTSIKKPVTLVALVNDEAAFQDWYAVKAAPVDTLYASSFKKQTGVVVDFGEHLTGHYTFTLKAIRGTPDAPLRFRFTFGEVPSEVAVPLDPYPGTLSRAWLQDEVVTVMDLPATITIPRRVSFRYVKIELLGSSPYFDFGFTDMKLRATTSAATLPAPLAAAADPLIKKIDSIGQATLKECMQTVFEDGPKRDRRLWIGDLYLQAKTNAVSFRNHNLTKRCLYLLAALSGEDGYLHSNVFETPAPHAQIGAPFLFDYSLLYNATLKDYLIATGDRKTAEDLWPVAKKQLENINLFLLTNGLFDNAAAAKAGWWLFVDWNDALDRQTAIQGIIIFALKETLTLATLLGRQSEVIELPALIKKMTAAARTNLYDRQKGVFTSGPEKQASYASQAWMTLSGVATRAEAQRALKAIQQMPEAVNPGGPYLYHYFVKALLQAGLQQEGRRAVENYWGSMVKKGADTFWKYMIRPMNICHLITFIPLTAIAMPGVVRLFTLSASMQMFFNNKRCW